MSTEKASTQDLVEDIARKETSKIESFVRQFVPNREDAKDIVQDVFYNLILGLDDIRDIEKMTSWIYQTAKFKAIDFLRRKKPVYEHELKNEGDDSFFDWINFSPALQDIDLWKEEVWEVINSTLESLPVEQKDAFVLHEFEDMSIKQIAEIMNCNVNTVLSRKRYATLKLKENLKLSYNELKL